MENTFSHEEAAIVADLHARRNALQAALKEKDAIVKIFGTRGALVGGLLLFAGSLFFIPGLVISSGSWIIPTIISAAVSVITIIFSVIKYKRTNTAIIFAVPCIWFCAMAVYSTQMRYDLFVIKPVNSWYFLKFIPVLLLGSVTIYPIAMLVLFGPFSASAVRLHFPFNKFANRTVGLTTILWFPGVFLLLLAYFHIHKHPYLYTGIASHWECWLFNPSLIHIIHIIFIVPLVMLFVFIIINNIRKNNVEKIKRRMGLSILVSIIFLIVTATGLEVLNICHYFYGCYRGKLEIHSKLKDMLIFTGMILHMTGFIIIGASGTSRLLIRFVHSRWIREVKKELTRLDIELK